MINRIKFLVVLFFGVLGLSGCIVVDDEPAYSPHPYGSYESAIDYYHRPPRYDVSHHKYQTKVHPKKKHLGKHNPVKKPARPVKKEVKKISHHPISKKETIKKPEPKLPHKTDIKQPQKPKAKLPNKPVNGEIHHSKAPEQQYFKKEDFNNPKPEHKHHQGKHK